eukprot:TRINITY_DN5028_c0_g1_i1.p1 TRINITY_DN5028_c0_g1~~TRINITY_DN5028_c0_g1_i1.p1  ORF type:complete len:130 (-),score=3.43 TRINITY_DN5028_c0_g1_i1:431-820(-)
MELNLHSELWTLIFSLTEGKSVASIIPQACKQFNKLSNHEELWKSICRVNNIDMKIKPSNESWKQYYTSYHSRLQLFPLFGVEIGVTSDKELVTNPIARKESTMDYVTINRVNFWFNDHKPFFFEDVFC